MVTVEQVDFSLKSLVEPVSGKAEATQEGTGRPINGFIVHKEFTGQAIQQRQKKLWERLRKEFGQDSSQIGIIFTYSPYEYEEMFSEESA